jgi:hypothetical protein
MSTLGSDTDPAFEDGRRRDYRARISDGRSPAGSLTAPGPASSVSETDGMARLKQIVIDCETPSSLARFWAAALEEFAVRAYDDDEIARLAALGYTPETDPSVIIDGPPLELCFQQADLESRSKTPVHLDIEATDRDTEVERLVALGATVKERFERHTWMLDPAGNDFCVVDPR